MLELWDCLGDDKRTILEETIRENPLSRFVWFEKFLDSLIYRPGESRVSPNWEYWVRTLLVSSSRALFRVYLRVLTTPGRGTGSIARIVPFDTPIVHIRWALRLHDWRVSVNMDDVYTNPYLAKVDAGSDILSDPGWLQLQQAVQELPLEIIRMIQDSMYEPVFGPKDVVLPYVDPKDLRHFGDLNSELYDRYHSLYYSENMWILADGPLDEIDEWFTKMYRSTLSAIKNVTIRWTRADFDETEWLKLEPDRFIETQVDRGGSEGLNNIQALNDYARACQRISDYLKHIWTEKLMILRELNLDLLVVDATDAYGPDGDYLGVEVYPLITWFESNLPCYLQVWAPDDELASQIYDHIMLRQ